MGEIANFVAYIYAPAVLVTPLGALSIIVRYISCSCALLLFGACPYVLLVCTASTFLTKFVLYLNNVGQCCFSAFLVEREATENGDVGLPSLYCGFYSNCASCT